MSITTRTASGPAQSQTEAGPSPDVGEPAKGPGAVVHVSGRPGEVALHHSPARTPSGLRCRAPGRCLGGGAGAASPFQSLHKPEPVVGRGAALFPSDEKVKLPVVLGEDRARRCQQAALTRTRTTALVLHSSARGVPRAATGNAPWPDKQQMGRSWGHGPHTPAICLSGRKLGRSTAAPQGRSRRRGHSPETRPHVGAASSLSRTDFLVTVTGSAPAPSLRQDRRSGAAGSHATRLCLSSDATCCSRCGWFLSREGGGTRNEGRTDGCKVMAS